jgi:hypothetical protein
MRQELSVNCGRTPPLLTEIFVCVFCHCLQANAGILSLFGCNGVLPNALQLVIHVTSYHSTLHSAILNVSRNNLTTQNFYVQIVCNEYLAICNKTILVFIKCDTIAEQQICVR